MPLQIVILLYVVALLIFGLIYYLEKKQSDNLSSKISQPRPTRQIEVSVPATGYRSAHVELKNDNSYTMPEIIRMVRHNNRYQTRFTEELIHHTIETYFPATRHQKLKQQFEHIQTAYIRAVGHRNAELLPLYFRENPRIMLVRVILFLTALIIEAKNPDEDTMDDLIYRIEYDYYALLSESTV